MKEKNFLSAWIKRFLIEYLVSERNLSKNTQHSYRDTFQLCLPFVAKERNKLIDQLVIDDLSSKIVTKFLMHLEVKRKCSISTRNQRLAAIHAFSRFVGSYSLEHIEWYRQIHLIPFKRTGSPQIDYLEKNEMDALLNSPNRNTSQGYRDYVILLFLYNTGCRADEIVNLKIKDLDLSSSVNKNAFSSVMIKGKGNKTRCCPLWDDTAKKLSSLVLARAKDESIFLNKNHQTFTRFGIYSLVKRYIKKIVSQLPSLEKKQISPHTIRHTTATHLLRAGVDINTIRAWLGHVSVNTTNIYAEIDLEMKAKALSLCEITNKKANRSWSTDKSLMAFLKAL